MARILIIDDSPDMLAMLRMFVERRTNHEPLLARSGGEGLAMAFDKRPELALVDVMMPGMDGYEVVRRLRRDRRTEGMGIIILTARGQIVDEEAALKAGADRYLSKPVNMETLGEAIVELLERRGAHGAGRTALLPVVSLKGGVGVTTVAVNLAVLLQQVGPTVLWDLSPTSGHTPLFLGLHPKTHWGLYLRDSRQPVTAQLQTHRCGLRLLCAPPVPGTYSGFDPGTITTVLQALSADASFVVVDMPPTLNPVTAPIMDGAERILLLSGDDPPSIQSTLATLQALQSRQERIFTIHNTVTPEKRPTTETLGQLMRVRFDGSLPYDSNQALALGRGVPLALAKADSPLVLGLKEIVQRLLRP